MIKDTFIRLDSEEGLKLGLSSWVYDSVICYDLRPACIDFIAVYVKPHINAQWVLEDLFDRLTDIPTRFTAPSALIKEIALRRGYEAGVQPEGTPFVTNSKLLAQKQPTHTTQAHKQESDCPAFLRGLRLDDIFL